MLRPRPEAQAARGRERDAARKCICYQAAGIELTFARFLVEAGIDSISFSPDALLKGIKNMLAAEAQLQAQTAPGKHDPVPQ